MAAIKISDVLGLIPATKLAVEFGDADKSDFDAQSAMRTRLQTPSEYPTLDLAVLPDDTVCVALESGTPAGFEITTEIINALRDLGVEPTNLSVLLAEGTRSSAVEELQTMLAVAGVDDVNLVVHDSNDRAASGFLSASESGDAILLNARLVHADFVIPIGIARQNGWKSQIEFLYPYFSDRESQQKFFKLNERSKVAFGKEVARWLGNTFGVLVLSNDGSSVTDVLVGGQLAIQKIAVNKLTDLSNLVGEHTTDPSASDSPQADLVIAEVGTHLYGSAAEVFQVFKSVKNHCIADGTCVVLWNDDRSLESFVDLEQTAFDPNERLDSENQNIFVCTDQPAIRKLGFSAISEISEIERLITQHKKCLPLLNFQFSA